MSRLGWFDIVKFEFVHGTSPRRSISRLGELEGQTRGAI